MRIVNGLIWLILCVSGNFFLKTERNSGIIISPDVNPFLSKEFCLKFQYGIDRGEILVDANTKNIILLNENDQLKYYSSSFTVNQSYNVSIKLFIIVTDLQFYNLKEVKFH